jgi:hypothetical protein
MIESYTSNPRSYHRHAPKTREKLAQRACSRSFTLVLSSVSWQHTNVTFKLDCFAVFCCFARALVPAPYLTSHRTRICLPPCPFLASPHWPSLSSAQHTWLTFVDCVSTLLLQHFKHSIYINIDINIDSISQLRLCPLRSISASLQCRGWTSVQ